MRTDGLIAEQLISKAKVALMNDPDWQWMASIIMMGTTEFVPADDEMTTAQTDGLNERYNKGFIEGLTLPQVKFIILHENYHKMFRHLFVWEKLWKQNAMMANIACDAVINTQYLLNKAGIDFVKGGVLMPDYADADLWNVKDVFDDLMKKAKANPQQAQPKAGHDEHDWEGATEMTEEEAEEVKKQVDNAIRQSALVGSMSGGMPRSVREMLVPAVDWRTLLAEFVKSACTGLDKATWRKPHRTYVAYDMYMPSPYSETMKRILLAGDTSGSIDDLMLCKFLGHMQCLVNEVNPDGVDIAWWDSKVAGVDSFERGGMDALANAVKPKGGGGTEPACITRWIDHEDKRDDYSCVVVITDGEFYSSDIGDWGELPVLWLVINKRPVANIPVGVTVHVREI